MKLPKLENTAFFQIIKYIFFLTFLIISYLLLVVSPSLDYMCKKIFIFPNSKLLVLDAFIFIAIYIIYKKFGKNLSDFIDKYAIIFILVSSILLFFGQLYLSYNIYFLTGWDAGDVFKTAQTIAVGNTPNAFNAYFSRYPNNITLAWIFSEIIKVSSKFSILYSHNMLLPIIVINCFISSLSGILTYKSVEKVINKKWAIFSWFIYLLLIGISPWVVITYSDPLALFLPILIFFIYTREFTGKYNLVKWLIIGIISFLGYHIKPQVIIILIAIVIIEIWRFIFLANAEKKKKCIIILVLIFTFFLSNIFYKAITKQTGFNLNKEDAFGLTHFVMMGLNDETDGVYSGKDVAYSASFVNSSERKKANIEVIKERLNNFGVFNYMKFLSKKTLVNYGDGTFAWGAEGNFYTEIYPDKNSWISPLLKSFCYSGRKNYDKTSTLQQAIWIWVIVSMLGLVFIKQRCMNNKIAVLMLSIIGLTMFELLFESRARYLYIYAPIYITLSMVGLKNVIFQITKLKQRLQLNKKIDNR